MNRINIYFNFNRVLRRSLCHLPIIVVCFFAHFVAVVGCVDFDALPSNAKKKKMNIFDPQKNENPQLANCKITSPIAWNDRNSTTSKTTKTNQTASEWNKIAKQRTTKISVSRCHLNVVTSRNCYGKQRQRRRHRLLS